MKNLKLLFLVIALTFSTNAKAVVVGEKAPDFNVKDINGTEVKLGNFADKIVVLEWHNAQCPFVKKHYEGGNMQALQKQYAEKGIVWISVNSGAKGKQGYYENNEAAIADLKEKNWSGSHYVRDELGEFGKAYGAATTPHMFIINKGILVYAGAIDSNPSTNPDDVKNAENYVSKALDELLAGKPVSTAKTQQYGCSVKY